MKSQRTEPVPLEFRLLSLITTAFAHRSDNGGWICVSQSELRNQFFRHCRCDLSLNEFRRRVLPGWVRRGIAKLVVVAGRRKPRIAVHPMTADEINYRLVSINARGRRLADLYAKHKKMSVAVALRRLFWEASALRSDRAALLGRKIGSKIEQTQNDRKE